MREALAGYEIPIKWIGDEAMLWFPEPDLGDPGAWNVVVGMPGRTALPLTRSALNHLGRSFAGQTISSDRPSMWRRAWRRLCPPANCLPPNPSPRRPRPEAFWCRISGRWRCGRWPNEIQLYEIGLAPSPDPAWIDPVCKMHAPYASYRRAAPEGPWFCSPRCEEAYLESPQTYPLPR